MFGVTPLTPAYGRDYQSEEEVLQDWNDNKDFKTVARGYCSKSDFAGQRGIEVRYNRLTELVMVDGD